MTNGIGIIRDIAFFDDDLRKSHPDVVSKKSKNSDSDKKISDSHYLKPVLSDIFKKHPKLSYSTFLGSVAFDSYDNYTMLKMISHSSAFAPNQYLASLHALSPVKLLALHPPTENALIHIPTRISECIRVFRETQNTGIIYTSIECISKEQYFSKGLFRA